MFLLLGISYEVLETDIERGLLQRK